MQAPRSWAERAYPKLIYYNRLAKGGHFAAWEQPELFSDEMRAAFQAAALTEVERGIYRTGGESIIPVAGPICYDGRILSRDPEQ